MTCYLFITKPDYDVAAIKKSSPGWWSCSKSTRTGDRLFVYVTEGGGIVREWKATTDAYPSKKWGYRCDVAFVRVVAPAIHIGDLTAAVPREVWAAPHLHFRGYTSIQVPPDVVAFIDGVMAQSTPSSKSARISLASSRHHGGDIETLSLAGLAADMESATEVRLASAFYDVPTLEGLLARKRSEKPRRVQVLLNGLGGDRLASQKRELGELSQRLEKRGDQAEVRLAFEPGLFHTKLLIVRRGMQRTVWVGSANATVPALGDRTNEEILVRMQDEHGVFTKYFDSTFANPRLTKGLAEIDAEHAARSLIAFFRTGTLYFKPTASLQKTVNPFYELLGALPATERAKFERTSFAYADSAGAIGPFNIVRALRDSAPTSAPSDDGGEESTSDVRFKFLAIETSLGFWVPAAYVPTANRKIQAAGKKRLAYLRTLLGDLQRVGRDQVEARYSQYLGSVREGLSVLEIDWQVHLAKAPNGRDRRFPAADPFASQPSFRKAFDRLEDTLTKHSDRLSAPYRDEVMPEIWNDPVASESFAESFFEFLEDVALRGSRPKAAGAILDAVGVGSGASAEEIRDALETLLKSEGWRRSDWPKIRETPTGDTVE